MKNNNSDSNKQLAIRLFKEYVKAHLKKIILAVLCMVIAAAATAANAFMMKPVIDEIFLKNNRDLLLIIPIAILAIAFIKGFAVYFQSVILKYVGQRTTSDMQLSLYDHLLYSDISLFSKESSGKLISRFSNDINIIRKNLSNVLIGLFKESLTFIFLLGVMLYQSVELTLITFLVLPIAIFPVLRLGKRMNKVSRQTQEELGLFTAKLDDTFQGVRIVKSYGNEKHEIGKARNVIERIFDLYIKTARIESAASPIMEALAGVAIAAVVWYGGSQVLDGVTTPGAFFSFITALIMTYKPMKSLSNINTYLQEALASIKRFFAIIDTKPKIKDARGAKALKLKKAGIELNNVSFSYGDDKSALKDLSIKVKAGEKIALVGASGGGKSTIMNLILRFYDPDQGKVLVGGEDITKVKVASLREHIAVVNQEATLFDDTVRANILYGKKNATEKELLKAAKSAVADDFIKELPEGYDTSIGQHGLRLSGGQRQRIAIARAMLRDAPILLLDEATSALDTISEKQVQKALDKLMSGRTTIVIAHRLSTIMHVDKIYVIDKGQVVESGNHKTLLAKRGAYHSLYERQFSEKETKSAA